MSERPYEGTELELFAHAKNWKAYWSSEIAPFMGKHVLDVGAGIGATAAALHDVPFDRWVALEPDPRLAQRISASVQAGTLHPSVEARCGTMLELDPAERYDTILYIDVLEHIENDAAELAGAARHLSPGGRLIVVAPAHNWLYTPFDRAIGHHRRYNRRSLLAIVPNTLTVERIRYLDSAGMLASLGNKLLLRSASPTLAQIGLWDRCLVPVSRTLDRALLGRVGKSIVCVLKGMNQQPIDATS